MVIKWMLQVKMGYVIRQWHDYKGPRVNQEPCKNCRAHAIDHNHQNQMRSNWKIKEVGKLWGMWPERGSIGGGSRAQREPRRCLGGRRSWSRRECYSRCEPWRHHSLRVPAIYTSQSDVGTGAAKDFSHRDLEGDVGLPQRIFEVGEPGVFWKNTYQSKTQDYVKRQLTLLFGGKCTWGL